MNAKEKIIVPAVMQCPDYQQALLQLIKSNTSPKALKEQLSNYHESDIAAIFQLLSKGERERLYRILDSSTLANIFEYIEDLTPYIQELSVKQTLEILSAMETDAAVSYLRQLDKTDRSTLIDLMDDTAKQDIMLLQSFDEDEIGSVMTTNYIEITRKVNVREAMRLLVEQAADNDNISKIYVVDESRVFYGTIDLKDLIIARESTDLEEIITTAYPYVYAQEQIEDCIPRIKGYAEDSVPVLDRENRLLGVITAQDLVEFVDEELGEDYAKLGGLSAEEDLNESVRASIRKRLPWLLILLVLGIVVSSVVGLFEAVVAQLTIVICFQSLVLDMSGNVGTQSLAVTIRVLMDEQLNGKQKRSLIAKETKIGLANGVILGIITFIVIGVYTYLFKQKPIGFAFAISACTGTALLLAMLLSALSGTVIPILFKKLHVDPAVASGPLITTVNDLVAVVAYYGLSWIFLIQILHISG